VSAADDLQAGVRLLFFWRAVRRNDLAAHDVWAAAMHTYHGTTQSCPTRITSLSSISSAFT
jgi:hypothetical protein